MVKRNLSGDRLKDFIRENAPKSPTDAGEAKDAASDPFEVRSLAPRRTTVEVVGQRQEPARQPATPAMQQSRPAPRGQRRNNVGGAFGRKHYGSARPPQQTAKKKEKRRYGVSVLPPIRFMEEKDTSSMHEGLPFSQWPEWPERKDKKW